MAHERGVDARQRSDVLGGLLWRVVGRGVCMAARFDALLVYRFDVRVGAVRPLKKRGCCHCTLLTGEAYVVLYPGGDAVHTYKV